MSGKKFSRKKIRAPEEKADDSGGGGEKERQTEREREIERNFG